METDVSPGVDVDADNTVTKSLEGDTLPSLAIVDAVATAAGVTPTEITPLQSTVDTDALDGLLAPDSGGYPDLHLSFEHDGYVVEYRGDGIVVVR